MAREPAATPAIGIPAHGTSEYLLLNFTGEFGSIQYGPLFAAICITVFGTLILFLALNQKVMKGLAGGAVKG